MVAQVSIFDRAVELLASQPSDEEIIAFKATAEEEARVDRLSALRAGNAITDDEEEELRNSLLVEYMMGIAKAKAFGRMNNPVK